MTAATSDQALGRPRAVPVNLDTIPAQLKQARRWVGWSYVADTDPETSEVSWDKPPRRARGGGLASTTDPRTWVTFDDAVAVFQRGGLDGLGFVLSADPGSDERLVGVDLDKCRDPDTGAIEPWAGEIVRELNSYTEISPSGRGLRIFPIGRLPPSRQPQATGARHRLRRLEANQAGALDGDDFQGGEGQGAAREAEG
jgi:primase-polymerase (primpol)-like protein